MVWQHGEDYEGTSIPDRQGHLYKVSAWGMSLPWCQLLSFFVQMYIFLICSIYHPYLPYFPFGLRITSIGQVVVTYVLIPALVCRASSLQGSHDYTEKPCLGRGWCPRLHHDPPDRCVINPLALELQKSLKSPGKC